MVELKRICGLIEVDFSFMLNDWSMLAILNFWLQISLGAIIMQWLYSIIQITDKLNKKLLASIDIGNQNHTKIAVLLPTILGWWNAAFRHFSMFLWNTQSRRHWSSEKIPSFFGKVPILCRTVNGRENPCTDFNRNDRQRASNQLNNFEQ